MSAPEEREAVVSYLKREAAEYDATERPHQGRLVADVLAQVARAINHGEHLDVSRKCIFCNSPILREAVSGYCSNACGFADARQATRGET